MLHSDLNSIELLLCCFGEVKPVKNKCKQKTDDSFWHKLPFFNPQVDDYKTSSGLKQDTRVFIQTTVSVMAI